MRTNIKTDTDSPYGFCGRVALSPSKYIFALASMSLRDLFFSPTVDKYFWLHINTVITF